MPFPLLALLGGAAALYLVTRKGEVRSEAAPGTGAPGDAPAPGATPAGCEGLTGKLPAPPAGNTGFDALPKTPVADLGGKSIYDMYFESMLLKPNSPGMTRLTQEAAALGCEEKAKILRCNGYTQAADQLVQQAAEIRQWKLGGAYS